MATELFAAIKGGDGPAVDRLLERDPTLVEARDENGLSPLLSALYRGKNDIAAAILRRRPTLTIFEASAAGDLERVRALVGADRGLANATSDDGYSPLGLAAFFKRPEVVRYLIDAGADPRRPSRGQGFTPLHSAVATDVAASDAEMVRVLLEAGADPNARSREGTTPLHAAAFTGDRAILDLLLERGADATIKSAQGKTPLDIARERRNDELVRRLEDRLPQR